MATKTLRFGGPNLPAGTHTFYITKDSSEVRAEVGHDVDPDTMVNAQEFIDRGMASLVSGKPAPKTEAS